jgi:hypothetical protein
MRKLLMAAALLAVSAGLGLAFDDTVSRGFDIEEYRAWQRMRWEEKLEGRDYSWRRSFDLYVCNLRTARVIAERRWPMSVEKEAAEAMELCSFFVGAAAKKMPADTVERLVAAIRKENVKTILQTRNPPSVVCTDYSHPCGWPRR